MIYLKHRYVWEIKYSLYVYVKDKLIQLLSSKFSVLFAGGTDAWDGHLETETRQE